MRQFRMYYVIHRNLHLYGCLQENKIKFWSLFHIITSQRLNTQLYCLYRISLQIYHPIMDQPIWTVPIRTPKIGQHWPQSMLREFMILYLSLALWNARFWAPIFSLSKGRFHPLRTGSKSWRNASGFPLGLNRWLLAITYWVASVQFK